MSDLLTTRIWRVAIAEGPAIEFGVLEVFDEHGVPVTAPEPEKAPQTTKDAL